MHNIVIAVTGASGSIYAKGLLDKLMTLRDQWNHLGVLMSPNAQDVWRHELGDTSYERYTSEFPGVTSYDKNDFTAPFASGSGQYDIMVVVPCSMGTLGRIAHGTSSDLLTRAADVVLKERRKLILVAREMPYNLIHIRNMEQVTLAGGIICPATPSFYSRPQTVEAVAATVVDRIVDLMGLRQHTYRWGGQD
jgi:4-hydroxy-3-polyprenylbenzoate decarboxylase